jgi:hypothetical protein
MDVAIKTYKKQFVPLLYLKIWSLGQQKAQKKFFLLPVVSLLIYLAKLGAVKT